MVQHFVEDLAIVLDIFGSVVLREFRLLVISYIDQLEILIILGENDGLRGDRIVGYMILLDILHGIEQLGLETIHYLGRSHR